MGILQHICLINIQLSQQRQAALILLLHRRLSRVKLFSSILELYSCQYLAVGDIYKPGLQSKKQACHHETVFELLFDARKPL